VFVPFPSHAQVKPFVHEGQKFVRLDELARFYGGEMVPSPLGHVKVKSRWTELEFEPGKKFAKIGNTIVWLHVPMQRIKWHWAIHYADALNVIDPIMRPSEYLKTKQPRVIVLDPGHGGKDPGALGKRGSKEKHGALDIARRVRRHLVAAGMKVRMTRENDHFMGLEARPAKAKKLGADLFVSIHLNSSAKRQASGIETFTLPSPKMPSYAGNTSSIIMPGNTYDAQNSLLGFHIHRSLVGNLSVVDRGLKHARFIVLRNAPCPAVLIECGFLSHDNEETKMMRESYREALAKNIAKGIMIYVGLSKRAQKVNQ